MDKSCLIMKGKQDKATRQRRPFKAFRTNRPPPGMGARAPEAPRSSGKLALCDWITVIPFFLICPPDLWFPFGKWTGFFFPFQRVDRNSSSLSH